MSTPRTPVGPQPPSVYRRRRLLVGLGVVAVIVVILLIAFRPGSSPSGATTPAASAPVPTGSGNPSPTFTSGGVASGTCDPAQVQLTAVTDASSYGSGAQPKISMKILNTGATPCSFDVGTGAQEYVITSGADRIWSSKDCQTGPSSLIQTLDPGKELSTTPFAWDRTRSSTSTCTTTRAAVPAKGASYHLTVHLGSAVSAKTVQFLLN